MTQKITIKRPDDFHVHFRDGAMAELVIPHTVRQFKRGLVMPNLDPPIVTAQQVREYQKEIIENVMELQAPIDFVPLMTFYITPGMDLDAVRAFRLQPDLDVVAGKLYPRNVTTGSEYGPSDIKALFPIFEVMQQEDLVLCLHGETPGIYALDREKHFHRTLAEICDNFRQLRVVLEHITDEDSVEFVRAIYDNYGGKVAATITAHHLHLTTDDVIGGKLNPHAFCMPIAKHPADREALIAAATSGHPAFFFGSDSAPHDTRQKECAGGCAGIFSAPCALESIIPVFERREALDKLENFTSRYGADFYGLPPNTGTVTFVKKPWKVPTYISNRTGLTTSDALPRLLQVVPFMCGRELAWQQVAHNSQ